MLAGAATVPFTAHAQFAQLTDFTGGAAFTGDSPTLNQDVIAIGDTLYGLANSGGNYSGGVIFKMRKDGSNYTKLHEFTGTDGRNPDGSLIYDGTYLYGTTYTGGTFNGGVFFRIKPDGTGFANLYNFSSPNNPQGSLSSDGTAFYGVTRYGGASMMGSIFRIMPDGTGYTVLHELQGTEGAYAYGSLFLQGGFLYGMTYSGGVNNLGTVFKVSTDGSTFTKLLDYDGANNGAHPMGNTFYSDGTYLYGMTTYGGSNDNGVIFKMLPDGTGFTKLKDCNSFDGQNPRGRLISDGSYLYGLNSQGGSAGGYGDAFRMLPDGSGYTQLTSFDGTIVNYPQGSFLYDGTTLFAMNTSGGNSHQGSVFRLNTDGSGLTNLFSFNAATNGHASYGSLTTDGTYLYGLAYDGGLNNQGALYRIGKDGSGDTVLFNFNYYSGINPAGSLYYDGTYLYGRTNGGAFASGSIFRIMPDGSNYMNLYLCNNSDFGVSGPNSSFVSDGTYLYGTSQYGGANNDGTVFRALLDGSSYDILYSFSGIDGNMPGGLALAGTTLYGYTDHGGVNGYGTLYSINTDGSSYNTLLDFDNDLYGNEPTDALMYDGTALYGMTLQGGTGNVGTIFRILPDGTGYTRLYDFNGTDGRYPRSTSLVEHNNYLYGMTEQGGNYYSGNIFRIKKDGTDFTDLYDFSNNGQGKYPNSTLLFDGPTVYGTTYYGGMVNAGTVFRFCPFATSTQSPVVCAGQSFTVAGNTYTASGTYTDTFSSPTACDSIVTTNLTVLSPISSSPGYSVCDGGSVTVHGVTYTATGFYTQTIIAGSYQGCDSTMNITVNVLAPININVTVSGLTLTADEGGSTGYQWIDCNNGGAPIAGETNQTFNASSDGSYAVIITDGDCSATSSCYTVTTTGIAEHTAANSFSVFPNPNSGSCVIKASAAGIYTLQNSLGQVIETYKLNGSNNYQVAISSLANGIYFISNEKHMQQKIVVAN